MRVERHRPVIPQLKNSVALISGETQALLIERYQAFPWRADFEASPSTFWFERPEGPAVFRPHFVGSHSTTSKAWLWGWANVSGYPSDATELADAVREFGERFEVPELTVRAQEYQDGMSESYVAAAQSIGGVYAHYRGPAGGTYMWFLLENPAEFSLPQPTPSTITRTLYEGLDGSWVVDQEAALADYATRRGGMTWERSGDTGVFSTATGEVHVEFDAQDKVRGLMTVGAELDAAALQPRLSEGTSARTPAEPRRKGLFARLQSR